MKANLNSGKRLISMCHTHALSFDEWFACLTAQLKKSIYGQIQNLLAYNMKI